MIASVIIRLENGLNSNSRRFQALRDALAAEPDLELGEIVDGHSLPATIDCQSKNEVHDVTRRLQLLDGIEFVDVVFVCLEHELDSGPDNQDRALNSVRHASQNQ